MAGFEWLSKLVYGDPDRKECEVDYSPLISDLGELPCHNSIENLPKRTYAKEVASDLQERMDRIEERRKRERIEAFERARKEKEMKEALVKGFPVGTLPKILEAQKRHLPVFVGGRSKK